MRCPYLREAQVQSCGVSEYKKMIVRTNEQNNDERCCSTEWRSCNAARQYVKEQPKSDRCPFLEDSLAQYCSAASVTTMVPYNDATHSHCTTEDHKYCEFYVASRSKEDPMKTIIDGQKSSSDTGNVRFEMFPLPIDRAFTPNHMWVDVNEHRTCHVGIDALLARVLGKIDGVSFVTTSGTALPTASFNVRGIDLLMAFPNQMVLTGLNTYLRSRPDNVTSNPYTIGWLFEGIEIKESGGNTVHAVDKGCIRGEQAREWMRGESERITSYASEKLSRTRQQELPTLMDGGVFVEGLVNYLSREETLQLFNEFFSPAVKWRLA